MATILQLSDVHLGSTPDQPRAVLAPLYDALAMLRAADGRAPDVLAITGDLFDSGSGDARAAWAHVERFLGEVTAALGRSDIPTVILPGNHDRRRAGLLGPHDPRLFDTLRAELGERAWVVGCRTPFLAEVVPPAFHRLPCTLVAYDSTYLPTGLVSAGGLLRQDDLLAVADAVADEPRERPLVLLTHHHLVPTPLTDLSRVDVNTQSRVLHFLARKVLGRLISNADREELMMTALGAGTALSTLHALDRPVLVAHGHKHYPTARALRAAHDAQGDVLLVAAGSAGTLLSFSPRDDDDDVATLWPSFNLIEVDDAGVAVDIVAFSPRSAHKPEPTRIARRPLVRAARAGTRWRVAPVARDPVNAGPVLARNAGVFALAPNAVRGAALWDIACTRSVVRGEGEHLAEYVDVQRAAPGARMVDVHAGAQRARGPHRVGAPLHLPLDGTPVRFTLVGGACRTVAEASRVNDEVTAFESIEMLNRYQSREALLVVEGLSDSSPEGRAFGALLDMTTGIERPARLERAPGRVALRVSDCPPRTLLRVVWPLAR